jgi:hypothetical protein
MFFVSPHATFRQCNILYPTRIIELLPDSPSVAVCRYLSVLVMSIDADAPGSNWNYWVALLDSCKLYSRLCEPVTLMNCYGNSCKIVPWTKYVGTNLFIVIISGELIRVYYYIL